MKLTSLLFATLLMNAMSFAQVPRYITHQGFLTRATGEPYDTTISITLNLYVDSTTSTNIYGQTINNVTVTKGIFNVTMGPISLPFDQQYWLGVTAGNQILTPRIKLTSVAYALRADTASYSLSTKRVYARYDAPGDQSVSGTDGQILNLIKVLDTHDAALTTSPWVYQIPVSGVYEISAVARVIYTPASTTLNVSTLNVDITYVNSSTLSTMLDLKVKDYTTDANIFLTGSNIISFQTGDKISIRFYQDPIRSGTINASTRVTLERIGD